MHRFQVGPPTMPPFDLPIPLRFVPQVKQTLGELYKAAYALGAADGFSIGLAAGEAAGILTGVALGLVTSAAIAAISTAIVLLFRRREPR